MDTRVTLHHCNMILYTVRKCLSSYPLKEIQLGIQNFERYGMAKYVEKQIPNQE